MYLVLNFCNSQFLTMLRRKWSLKLARTLPRLKISPWISLPLVKICTARLNIPSQKMFLSCHWFKHRKFFCIWHWYLVFDSIWFHSIQIRDRLVFAVGTVALNGFRMIERHYFRDKLVKSFDFSFGFCIPGSTNTWDSVYALPPLSEELSELFYLINYLLIYWWLDGCNSQRNDRKPFRNQKWFILFRER